MTHSPFSVQPEGEFFRFMRSCFSGRFQRTRRRQIPQRAMRPMPIVVESPRVQFVLGIGRRQEPVLIQAFGSQLPVERFDGCIVRWLAWTDISRPSRSQVQVLYRPIERSRWLGQRVKHVMTLLQLPKNRKKAIQCQLCGTSKFGRSGLRFKISAESMK